MLAMVTAGVVNICWMVSIALGASSTFIIITDFRWDQVPIATAYFVGGLVGTWLGMLKRKNK